MTLREALINSKSKLELIRIPVYDKETRLAVEDVINDLSVCIEAIDKSNAESKQDEDANTENES